ncbi:hypothetical protein CMI47_06920 [Candidatus Pacearchaeota archaeon]|nr:hypothetical protein [Candidatus Pacearchaeota archaeon]|tara:strand:- start:3567 stop:4955 length:1389 start_codon:yes stop_codon:yes gene_type:complete
MSKSLYDEAIAEARMLREAAEQNAKNAIIEAVTPKIRKFIEAQLVSENDADDSDDKDSEREDDDSHVLTGSSDKDEDPDKTIKPLPVYENDVALDETALMSLIELLGGADVSDAMLSTTSEGAMRSAASATLDSLCEEEKKKLLSIANKFNENADLFDTKVINIQDDSQTENQDMSKNDDVLYEIDLNALEKEFSLTESNLDEVSLELDLGDVELADDLRDALSTASVSVVEDEDVDGDVDVEEEPSDDEGEEEVALDDLPDLPELEEEDVLYEIDENVLRSELKRLRSQLSEGEAKAMAHHFGGGKAGKDALELGDKDINVLKEMRKLKRNLKDESRHNRALKNKLNEYRSAVETLREQLTDLNLFNAKLLYVNKLLQNPSVSATQRKSIIESLDDARSLREVKLLYKSLTESLSKGKSENLSESTARKTLGASSRPTKRASAKLSEAKEVSRWAQLAGLK